RLHYVNALLGEPRLSTHRKLCRTPCLAVKQACFSVMAAKHLLQKLGQTLGIGKLTMQGTMSSSLVANLLLICDNHRDERLRFEIFLGHVLYIFTCDLSNKIGVSVRIVQPQLKIFNLGQESRDLSVGIEAQRKAPGQIILRI